MADIASTGHSHSHLIRVAKGSRITEVDLDVRGERKSLMIGHLFAAVPGQGLVELVGQFVGMLDESINDCLSILLSDLR